MKRIIISCMVVLAALSASAQKEPAGIADHMGLSVGVGTTGVTVDLSTMFTDYIGVRVGADIFPKIKYKTDLDLDIPSDAQQTWEQVRANVPTLPNLPKDIEVEGKTNMAGGHLLVDVHPFKSSFRLTVGAYLNQDKVISVYNTSQQAVLRSIYQYNHHTGDFSNIPQTSGAPAKIGAELGDYFLEPDAQGNVEANIKVNKFRPYVGLGFGRAVPKKRIGCQFDLGVQFWGSPAVYMQDSKLEESNLDSDSGEIIKTISKVSVYPSLTLRLVGRIF